LRIEDGGGGGVGEGKRRRISNDFKEHYYYHHYYYFYTFPADEKVLARTGIYLFIYITAECNMRVHTSEFTLSTFNHHHRHHHHHHHERKGFEENEQEMGY